eukprot:c25869_g1_i1.p1 GENE.c25869_g1_i1~~c25869_g1_i1.p1  ORF type:complete len:236 (+),score=37.28 c25869_g1_i1:37-708(+)
MKACVGTVLVVFLALCTTQGLANTHINRQSYESGMPQTHEDCSEAVETIAKNKPTFEEHKALASSGLRRAHLRNPSKPVMMGRVYPEVIKYSGVATSFLQTSSNPGIVSDAGATLGHIADSYEKSIGKWSYGHCVCEVCHNIMEQLQVKMFSEYGYEFTDNDIHDVLEDSFCDHVLPYYRSPCQYILSYRYHSLASMVMYMVPYDICQTQRMCMGVPHPALTH